MDLGCSCFRAAVVCRRRGDAHDHQDIEGKLFENVKTFSYDDLRTATDNFHASNKIGRGGFGTVYKGILNNGRQVAVKTLSAESKQGVGKRLNSNPYLRFVQYSGYLAPEYVLGGQLTMKADVYSFGVLILEVVSGKSSGKANLGGMRKLLLEWAWQLYEEGKLLELVDPDMDEFSEEDVIRYIKVAFFCTQASGNWRPTMSQVIEMLSRNDVQLNEKQLTAPGLFLDSSRVSKKKSLESSTSYQMSFAPITITQLTPR
ncbi:leucine-rich repeat transmembrane protein kinase [Actinidia rufa]|uniref:Leucine-rich repeat transmembrane protein kinase n=1 Tax=Actinidia rufa TaxID=165716 RepID=A0A7J0G610_9ERIC|nr:leucine-rich repeat transmembrane protein kinase [Actinidia rufa]